MKEITENINSEIKYFTNSVYVDEHFKPSKILEVSDPSQADILIIESMGVSFNHNDINGHVIVLNNSGSDYNSIIPRTFIIDYLNMIDRMLSEDYFVGMADLSDVLGASRGTLIYYAKFVDVNLLQSLVSELPEVKEQNELTIIISISRKESEFLKSISQLIVKKYPLSSVLLMQPAVQNHQESLIAEVIIFDKSTIEL